MPRIPPPKFVLVIGYAKVNFRDDAQDVDAIKSALVDAIEQEDLWVDDGEHDEETSYGFTVLRSEIVDADAVEANVRTEPQPGLAS